MAAGTARIQLAQASATPLTSPSLCRNALDDGEQGLFLVAPDKSETRVASYNHIGTRVLEAYIPSDIAGGDYEAKLGAERYEQ